MMEEDRHKGARPCFQTLLGRSLKNEGNSKLCKKNGRRDLASCGGGWTSPSKPHLLIRIYANVDTLMHFKMRS